MKRTGTLTMFDCLPGWLTQVWSVIEPKLRVEERGIENRLEYSAITNLSQRFLRDAVPLLLARSCQPSHSLSLLLNVLYHTMRQRASIN